MDLLPIGEGFAEFDLVVRQLDDGSLTVTDDDALSDAERVHVVALGDGLRARRVTAAAPELGETLAAELDAINGELTGCKLAWEAGQVYCEAQLPWSGEQLGLDRLKGFYDAVEQGARAQRARVAGALHATPAAAAEVPDLVVPRSFLPGAGQFGNEDRATMRFGRLDQVPGRGELSYGERESGRVRPVAPSGGGGGLVVAVIALLLLVGGGGAAVWLLDKPTPGPSGPSDDGDPVPGEPSAPTPGDEQPSGDTDLGSLVPDAPSSDPTPRRDPPRSSGGSGSASSTVLESKEQILRAAGSADAALRGRAVGAACEEPWLAAPGGRLALLEALDGRLEKESGLLLRDHLRNHPVDPFEALDCLAKTSNELVRRELIAQIGAAGKSPDAAAIAQLLAEQPDTADLIVEEALVRLGYPRDGAALRLIDARGGSAWVQVGGGELLRLLARKSLAHLLPLKDHADPQVRMAAAGLLSEAEDKDEALKVASALLRDEDLTVRQRAIEVMGELRNPKASWPLARALADEQDNYTRDLISGVVAKLPTAETARYLVALYQRGQPGDEAAAVAALHAQGKPESVDALIRALRSKDREVRLAALRALQVFQKQPALRDPVASAISEIRRLALDDSDREMRGIALQLHVAITGRRPKR